MPNTRIQAVKPAFIQLLKHYPEQVSRGELCREIRWNDLTDNQSYMNTCAVPAGYGLLQLSCHCLALE
jgi:hypothetical protein